MSYIGDFKLGSTLYDYFTSTDPDTGAPIVLTGSPVVSAYEDDSDTQITAGITLTASADSVVGLNRLVIVATSGNGYEVGKQYNLVITTGTVDGITAVGYVVSKFSIEKTGLNLSNTTISAGSIPALGIVDSGTLQSATGTTAVLRSAASFANSLVNGATLVLTGGTGAGQSRVITGYVGASDTATVDTWTTTPDNTSTYIIFPTPPVPATTTTNIVGNITGNLSGSIGSVGTGGITAASVASAALPSAKFDAADPVPANIKEVNDAAVSQGGSAPASPYGLT